ncbi:MBL fold metallo-hydrolase [Streptomyces sp. NPDC001890]|uniref:MBL fold metallo-hydrolase n=1 Tax=Streptomyces sp. NPDC001890 TaxID=3364620 RepID=UPI0036A51234
MHIPNELAEIAPGVHAWLPDFPGTWGMANCTLVASDSGALLVDTPYTAALTEALTAAAHRVLPPSASISTVVNSHANGDHSYGNGLFPHAEIISTDANLAHLCAEPEPAQLQALLDQCRTDEPFDRYMLAHFGRYDYRRLRLAPPTRTFSGQLDLQVGSTSVELIEVGPAHTAGDLIVHLPDHGVVVAGDVLFIGDVPVHWAGPLSGVVAACQQILDLDPHVVVPGHGPLVGTAEVRRYMHYITELRERIHTLHTQGMDVESAASLLLHEYRRPDLGLSERLAVLTATEYRHLTPTTDPLHLVQILGAAVRLAPDCVPATVPSRDTLMAELESLI